MFASVRTWAERWGEAPSDVFPTPVLGLGFVLKVKVCG